MVPNGLVVLLHQLLLGLDGVHGHDLDVLPNGLDPLEPPHEPVLERGFRILRVIHVVHVVVQLGAVLLLGRPDDFLKRHIVFVELSVQHQTFITIKEFFARF